MTATVNQEEPAAIRERSDDAALFTRMTAETEQWKTTPERWNWIRSEQTKTQKMQKRKLLGTLATVAVAGVAVVAVLLSQPVNRVSRFLRTGDIDQAMQLYWSTESLAAGEKDAQLASALQSAAAQVCDAFVNHEVDAEDAATTLSKLGTFGSGAEALLADTYARFRGYTGSQDHMDQAEKLASSGDYLAARTEYLLVVEEDSDYAQAREAAEECLSAYGESVAAQADAAIQEGDFSQALQTLKAGQETLLALEYYDSALDAKLLETYEALEAEILSGAAELAGQGDYAGAAAQIRNDTETYNHVTEALTEAENEYQALAQTSAVSAWAEQANALYAAGDYAGAFELLEELPDSEDAPTDEVDRLLEALEKRFVGDKLTEAKNTFAGDRYQVTAAVAVLEEALAVRDLTPLRTYRDELEALQPLWLALEPGAEKSGTAFRSESNFEALNGTSYPCGWIWGGDGATLLFHLGGAYDVLEGTFTVRRDDGAAASGSFEVLCDGVSVYTSPTLQHSDTKAVWVSVPISGCDTLTIRFSDDYTVSTTDDGYCYHGFCGPVVEKNLPDSE